MTRWRNVTSTDITSCSAESHFMSLLPLETGRSTCRQESGVRGFAHPFLVGVLPGQTEGFLTPMST